MIKKCKYCGTTENLFQLPSGYILNVCINHKKQFDIDKQKNRKSQKKCLICGTKENLVKIGDNIYNSCQDHYDQYKQIVYKKKQEKYIKKYGVEHIFQSNIINSISKQTKLKKYGNENYNNVEKAKESIKQKYGVEHTFSKNSPIVKNIKKELMEKHGVVNQFQRDVIKSSILKTRKNKYWNTFILKLEQKKIQPLFDKEYYLNNNEFKFKCLRCNKEWNSEISNPQNIYCNVCITNTSKYEDEIYSWLKSVNNNLNIERNKKGLIDKRKKLELDLYLPDYSLGIEFNGLYSHSEINKENSYHQEKWKLFKEQGINVIQIFQNEWLLKQNIIKSIILSKLNINQEKIYARKCEIKEINNNLYKTFLEQNHIQGTVQSKIKLGMFYENQLVSVIGISKSRFKKDEIEIIRYCTKLNVQVVGGLSKFLSYIKNNYQFNNIVSYIDLRYFNGFGYQKSGFKLESISSPNYYYFKNDNKFILHNRIQFQKHKLKNKLEKFDEKLTEVENMYNNGYLRIFDAGNYKMKLCV